jgi:hypothetical protein
MRHFLSNRNRDRARWLLVLLLVIVVIHLTKKIHFEEGVTELIRTVGIQNLFFSA